MHRFRKRLNSNRVLAVVFSMVDTTTNMFTGRLPQVAILGREFFPESDLISLGTVMKFHISN